MARGCTCSVPATNRLRLTSPDKGCQAFHLYATAVDALQNLMASKVAYPLTNDGKKTELYGNLYNISLQTAKYVDSQNDPNEGFIDNTLINVRF